MEWLSWVHGTTPAVPGTGQAGTVTVRPGDEVRVWFKILEQGKERLGQFEGIVLRSRGSGASKTFTVRRVTHGEGVERVFPLDARTVSKIDVLRQGKVKRSRLYFLRRTIGKSRIVSVEATPFAAPSPGVPPGEQVEAALIAADKPIEGLSSRP